MDENEAVYCFLGSSAQIWRVVFWKYGCGVLVLCNASGVYGVICVEGSVLDFRGVYGVL